MLEKIEIQDLESTPFHQACAEGNLDKCQELFEKKTLRLDAIHPKYFVTGLSFAVQNNHIHVVEWLLKNNASIYNQRSGKSYPGSQLVDMPFDKNKKTSQTAFSFCSNAQMYTLLSQNVGFFTPSQRIVILCEMMICQLQFELLDIPLVTADTIQSLVTKTDVYTDESITALNTLAKVFFDLEQYTNAIFCYESVKHLLVTKRHQKDPAKYAELNVKTEINVFSYNYDTVCLKINNNLIQSKVCGLFKNIGDAFFDSKDYEEAEQSYKKSLFYCDDANKDLKINLYLNITEICVDKIDYRCEKDARDSLIKTIQGNLNNLLETAQTISSIEKSTVLNLQEILYRLHYLKEYTILAAFCKHFIALEINKNDESWICLDIFLIISQVSLQTEIDEDIFNAIFEKSPKFSTEFSDNLDYYWKYLEVLHSLGDCFFDNGNYNYAHMCYKAICDISDYKRLEHDNEYERVYVDSVLDLIKTHKKLGAQITPDIINKLLVIEIQKYSLTCSVEIMLPAWKKVADLCVNSKKYTEAEQFYKKIFNAMFSDDWKSTLVEDADFSNNQIVTLTLPIDVAFDLVTSQIEQGMEIQEVMKIIFDKIGQMIQFLGTVYDLDKELDVALRKQVSLLFNKLGETISKDKDNQTSDLATLCFLSSYKVALSNKRNQYADVKPTLDKLYSHYQSMHKKTDFIEKLSMIFSSSLSPTNIESAFDGMYFNCLKAINKSNTIAMQFFTVAMNHMEKFVHQSGKKPKHTCDILWRDFFEKGNNKKRFLELLGKLKPSTQNTIQSNIKRKSYEEDLAGHIMKKHKTEVIAIEIEPSNEESVQNQQQTPYSYSQSANGFNHFFSIQENSKKRSKHKSAHHFDFDLTLTNQHVHDWKENAKPSKKICKSYLKSETINTLRFILQSGNYVSIITNGTGHRISWVLLQAGLTQQELDKISIKAAESPVLIVPKFKPEVIRSLAEAWKDAKTHYFYDDRVNFCSEVWAMQQEFKNKEKKLFVTHVARSVDDCSHLAYAWNKAAEYVNEEESIDNKQLAL